MTVIYVINQYAQYETTGIVHCCVPSFCNTGLISLNHFICGKWATRP